MITLTKKQVQQMVSQNGEPLSLDKFSWDRRTNTFSSCENDLVLDFDLINGASFTTGDNCTFTTDSYCTFTTGSDCTFTTDYDCTFTTGSDCTFKTGDYCTFKTGNGCTFTTDDDCTFTTGDDCTLNIKNNCIIETTGYKNNVLILRNRATSAKEIINLDDYEQNKLIEFKIGESPKIQATKKSIKNSNNTIDASHYRAAEAMLYSLEPFTYLTSAE